MDKKVFNILLLTNLDSDNCGDQVMEVCDIALLRTIMENLGVPEDEYKINSRAASIVTRKYIETGDEALLKNPRKVIGDNDVVVFGGAPMFNYLYQIFYLRTAKTVDLAKEAGVPVLFSAIGIEVFDPENPKCQFLTEHVNQDNVKLITTRDDYDSLKLIKQRDDLVIGKVADPAVFSKTVFQNFLKPKEEGAKKRIGLFLLRGNGFVDNKIDFSRDQAAEYWKDLTEELEGRGYEVNLITNGHFGDEAFMDYFWRKYSYPIGKFIFNVNDPETLVENISSFDAVVSCRLHPSIISFALDIPSLGVRWNGKVDGFYDSMGYADRVIDPTTVSAAETADRLEQILAEGVEKDTEYLASVYRYLFEAFRNVLGIPEDSVKCWDYDQICEHIPPFVGTTDAHKAAKLARKFRRSYMNYNKRGDLLNETKAALSEETKQRKALETRVAQLEQSVENWKNAVDKIHASKSYRLGHAIMKVPIEVKKAVSGKEKE